MLTRRDLLASGLALGTLSVGGVRAASLDLPADGADADDYRALVCVFLAGGLDAYDTVIPMDAGPHRDWRRVRGPLTEAYDASGVSRRPDALEAIGEDEGGAAYGLPPQMPLTAAAVRAGRAAIVANVGPLQASVTPQTLEARSVPLPPQLYSHADQSDYWRRLSGGGGLRTGWGGRLIQQLGERGPFGAVTGGRDAGFTMGPSGAGAVLGTLEPRFAFGMNDALWGDEELSRLFREHLTVMPEGGGLLERDLVRLQGDAAELSRDLVGLMESSDAGAEIAAGAKRDTLAYGLAIVARMIALRSETGARRQVFYVEMEGFDTHQDQANRLPPLQAELDEGLARFARWLDGAGLSQSVTTFTASDFGRTLTANKSGTDHGWGGHQIVLGGAVRGGLHGAVPPPVTGHAQDAGRGRMIPAFAVEQTAVPMARWLGLPEKDAASVFPFADRFDLNAVPLMRG